MVVETNVVPAPRAVGTQVESRTESTSASSSIGALPRGYCSPPVHSPLSAGALLRAIREASRGRAQRLLSEYLNDRFAAADVTLFDSGTHALTGAIRAAQKSIGGDSLVALPAFTCYDVATAASGANSRIVLYDVDPHTLGPDWTSFDAALAAGAGIVVVAPLYGYPVDWNLVEQKAGACGAIVIEDAAQAAGGEWNQHPIGSFGALSVLSFGRGKGWTGVRGGAVLDRLALAIDRPQAGSIADEVRNVVLSAAQLILSDPRLYGVPASIPWLHLGETRYREPSPAAGMGNFPASLLLATAALSLSSEVRIRRKNAALLQGIVSCEMGVVSIEPVLGADPGFLRFPFRITAPHVRNRFLHAFRRLGAAQSYPTSLSKLGPVQSRVINNGSRLPGAETLVAELVTLPTHSRSRSFGESARELNEILAVS